MWLEGQNKGLQDEVNHIWLQKQSQKQMLEELRYGLWPHSYILGMDLPQTYL